MSAPAGPLPTPIRAVRPIRVAHPLGRARARRLASFAALVTGLAAVCGGLTAAPAAAEPNGLAATPPMGWNSWNKFGCSIDENLVKQVTDSIVSSGLKAAGYTYVNLDDCWQLSRASDGTIQADPQKFPSGIKALADYVHGKGLKFGLYTDIGTATCQGRPGSHGHEAQDAGTYAAWGVDYVKVDWCNTSGYTASSAYQVMRDALNNAGRPILFSICNWGEQSPWVWGPSTGNSWRTTGDIQDSWNSVAGIIGQNDSHAASAGPGGWNDPDMLEVGNGGMTDTEYRAHMSLWALMAAPLIAGNDVRSMSQATKDILTAPEVIAVDQDALGRQGHKVTDDGNGRQVWSKVLTGSGKRAVALYNSSGSTADITASWSSLGLTAGSAAVRDLWARQDLGSSTGGVTRSVPAHGVVLLQVTGTEAGPAVHTVKTDPRQIDDLVVTVDFTTGGAKHRDTVDLGTLGAASSLALDAWGGYQSGDTYLGDFVYSRGSTTGTAGFDLQKLDPRTVTGVRLTVTFTIAGQPHYDYEDVGDLGAVRNLVLDARGGTWDGSRWIGNFLRGA